MRKIILLFTILLVFNSNSNAKDDTHGIRILNLLNQINKNDSISFFNEFMTIDDCNKLRNLILEGKRNPIEVCNEAKIKKEASKNYAEIRENLNYLGLKGKVLNYISEKNITGSLSGIPTVKNTLILTDGSYEYEVNSEFFNTNNIKKLTEIGDLINISKVYITNIESGDAKTFTINPNEKRADFKNRVIKHYLSSIINKGTFSMHAGLRQYNVDSYEIKHIKSVSFRFKIYGFKIEGGNLFGSSWSSHQNGLADFKLEIYNKYGIKIYEEISSCDIYNDGSGITPEFKEYELGNLNIYEDITVVIKLNEKIIFSRNDSWANFALGVLRFRKMNGKYYNQQGLSNEESIEIEDRMKYYEFLKLSY